CYTVTVGNGANMEIGIQYIDPVYGSLDASPWLRLDANGQAYVCTAAEQPVGRYTVTAVRSTSNSTWVSTQAWIDIFQQPTGLVIKPERGYAGVFSGYGSSCHTMTFLDGANMTVDMWASVSYIPNYQFVWQGAPVGADGVWAYCDGHDAIPGTLTVYAIKNAA